MNGRLTFDGVLIKMSIKLFPETLIYRELNYLVFNIMPENFQNVIISAGTSSDRGN